MKKRNIKIFILCLVIVYLVALIGSIFTSPNTNTDWYNSIRPSITPPNWVFPIVWNILFFLIACSLYLAWINSKNKDKSKLVWVFGINFGLNIFWSVLYFGLKNSLLSFFELILLEASIVGMILVTKKISKKASYLLWPYLIWVAFAGILNFLSAF